MLSQRAWWLPTAVVLVCGILLLGDSALAQNAPKALPKEDQDKVDRAIDKGIAILKRKQTKEGDWPQAFQGEFFVGQCALPAYALLEAGVPVDDPVILKAAKYLRPRVRNNGFTYELSLALLFFDRLGDPQDEKLIQSLAARLIAGQHYSGGWSYRCPVGKPDKEVALLKALKDLEKGVAEGKSPRQVYHDAAIPRVWMGLAVFQAKIALEETESQPTGNRGGLFTEGYPPFGFTARTDNSNTQFALLALWRAQQRDIPMKRTFALLVERFERSQYADGWWSYGYNPALGTMKHPFSFSRLYRSMVCAGLLSLAIGQGLKSPTLGARLPEQESSRMLDGLAALYSEIGSPTGQMKISAPPQNLYFLWSVERVGMLYDLPAIGDKDWYRWGAEMLIANQSASGKWWAGQPPAPDFGPEYGDVLNTAFALLFLKHAHPMKELTAKLSYKSEELNKGLVGLITGRPLPLERPTTIPSRSEKSKR
jgi:hypothetical protein